MSELRLEGCEHLFEVETGGFAEGVEVQPLDAVGQPLGEVVGHHSEAAAGECRIVDVRLYDRTLRVHPQSGRHRCLGMGCIVGLKVGLEAVPLAERVECDVAAPCEVCAYGLRCVGRAVGVHAGVQFLHAELQLVERRCRAPHAVFAENGECAPQCIGLERHDDGHSGLAGH